MFKRLFKKYFDYNVTGEYYDYDGHGRARVKYIKKYYFIPLRNLKRRLKR